MTAEPIPAPRLTSLSPGAGCACKLPLAKLEALFAGLEGAPAMGPAAGDLLVGAAEGDDAAVLRLDDDRALVLTTDFFTPIVDDPDDWGRIAAANALSDVYAMGGRPLFAVNLAAWPGEGLDLANTERMRGFAAVDPAVPPELAVLLHDAQTSGGLLLAAPPAAAAALLDELRAQGLPAALIGDVVAGESGHVAVYPTRSA